MKKIVLSLENTQNSDYKSCMISIFNIFFLKFKHYYFRYFLIIFYLINLKKVPESFLCFWLKTRVNFFLMIYEMIYFLIEIQMLFFYENLADNIFDFFFLTKTCRGNLFQFFFL